MTRPGPSTSSSRRARSTSSAAGRARSSSTSARSSPAAASGGCSGSRSTPQYATNDLVYVNYTNVSGDTRIARYRANAAHTRAPPATRRLLFALDQPEANHNGGRLAFGGNGRLYAGQGDGGGSCDPGGRAQNLRSRHGKLLSLNPRNVGAGWRIDAYGLRNPWGFSFDRANGRLYIGDVGQSAWEEVDTLAASRLGGTPENFMWDAYEGRDRERLLDRRPARARRPCVRPISVYSHSLGCSITGGFAYRGAEPPRRCAAGTTSPTTAPAASGG